ncbi:MAG: leucine-rich repeat protein [Bacilli bacterium]|nr:leucine-rich repeat protein [Bacilli bacterium]
MKSNKGFTMVEILAVVVVLGIVAIISTNIVLKHLEKSKKQAFITDVEQFVKSTNYDTLVKDKLEQYVIYSFPNSGIEILPKTDYSGFMIKDENDKVRIQIWNNNLGMCAVKSFTDKEAKIDENIETEEDCMAFLPNVTNSEISVKSLTGEDVNYNLTSSCYTLDADHKIDNFDTSTCGTIMIIPNKINGEHVNGITDDFYDNQPKNFTSLYVMGVKNLTDIPTGFLSDNPDFKKAILSNLPNLETIHSFVSNPNTNVFYLTNCPKLESIPSGILYAKNNLEYITLEGLPSVTSIGSDFEHSQLKEINISNFDSLTEITSMAFYDTQGDAKVTISNNPNLVRITSTALGSSMFKSLHIFNNQSFLEITNGALSCYDQNGCYIDELLIYNNPNLERINNSGFQGYEFNTIKLYNNPKLKNIQYSAFSKIKADVVDLSGLELETFDFTGWSQSKIGKLILPSTLTGFSYGDASNLNAIVTDSIEFGGSNKCSLIDLFRTSNGDGTYTYKVDKNKLPNCP